MSRILCYVRSSSFLRCCVVLKQILGLSGQKLCPLWVQCQPNRWMNAIQVYNIWEIHISVNGNIQFENIYIKKNKSANYCAIVKLYIYYVYVHQRSKHTKYMPSMHPSICYFCVHPLLAMWIYWVICSVHAFHVTSMPSMCFIE